MEDWKSVCHKIHGWDRVKNQSISMRKQESAKERSNLLTLNPLPCKFAMFGN